MSQFKCFPTLELLLNKQIRAAQLHIALFFHSAPCEGGCAAQHVEFNGEDHWQLGNHNCVWSHAGGALENNKTQTKFLGGHQVQQLRVFSKSVARKEQPTSGRKHAALSRSSRCCDETFSKKHSTFRIVSARHRNVKTFALLWWTSSFIIWWKRVFSARFFPPARKKCARCALQVFVFEFLRREISQLIKSIARSASFFSSLTWRERAQIGNQIIQKSPTCFLISLGSLLLL